MGAAGRSSRGLVLRGLVLRELVLRGLVPVAASGGVLACTAPAIPQAYATVATSGSRLADPLESQLGAVAVLMAAGASTWLLLVAAVALMCRLLRRPVPRVALALAPRAWRPVVVALAGSAVLVAAPATAAPRTPATPGSIDGASSASSAAVAPPASAFQGLPLPDRPSRPASGLASAPPSAASLPATHPPATRPPASRSAVAERSVGPGRRSARATPPPARTPTTYRVRVGDSLWSIASDAVVARGDAATTGRVNREWRRWYARNRPAIGADPDVLRVGVQLHVPDVARQPHPTPSAHSIDPTDEGDPR